MQVFISLQNAVYLSNTTNPSKSLLLCHLETYPYFCIERSSWLRLCGSCITSTSAISAHWNDNFNITYVINVCRWCKQQPRSNWNIVAFNTVNVLGISSRTDAGIARVRWVWYCLRSHLRKNIMPTRYCLIISRKDGRYQRG